LRIPVKLDLALITVRIVLVAALLPFAIGWRTPLFAGWRYLALAVLLALPLALIAAEIRTLRRAAASRALRAMSLALALVAFATTAAIEIDFQVKRRAVLAAGPQQLAKLGRHVLVGYRSPATLSALIERRGVAGIFLSAGNVAGKEPDAIRQEIDALQEIRRRQGVAPLWVLVVRKRSGRRIDVSRLGEVAMHGHFSGFGGFSDRRRC